MDDKDLEKITKQLNMQEDKTLSPCPFCGSDAKYEQDLRFEQASEDFPKWFVKCKKCGIKTPIATIPQVQALWNNRVR